MGTQSKVENRFIRRHIPPHQGQFLDLGQISGDQFDPGADAIRIALLPFQPNRNAVTLGITVFKNRKFVLKIVQDKIQISIQIEISKTCPKTPSTVLPAWPV